MAIERKKDNPETEEDIRRKRNELAMKYYGTNYAHLCWRRQETIDSLIKGEK